MNKSKKLEVGLGKLEFKKIILTSTDVHLADSVIDVLFCMFDEDGNYFDYYIKTQQLGDGTLNSSEFVDVITSRRCLSTNKVRPHFCQSDFVLLLDGSRVFQQTQTSHKYFTQLI